MNIAIFTKNWLGDVVFQFPAIEAVKQNVPGSRILAIAPSRCADLLKANPHVDEVIEFNDRDRDKGLGPIWRLSRELRQKNVERIYYFHRSFSRALVGFLAGAKVRVGYDTKGRGFLLTRAVKEPGRPVHATQYFLDLLVSAGLKVDGDYKYRFYFSNQDSARADEIIRLLGLAGKKLVALNPGANWLPKRWPVNRFAELARELVGAFDVHVLITGAPSDEVLADEIMKLAGSEKIHSVCGRTSILELGALFSKCTLMISNDSGPLHIAAGVGTNVIGIFGPTDPQMTGPLGSGKNVVVQYVPEGEKIPWYGKDFPYGNWMEYMTAAQILDVIRKEKLLA